MNTVSPQELKDALLSGKYERGAGSLTQWAQDGSGKKLYCCLGVLAKLIDDPVIDLHGNWIGGHDSVPWLDALTEQRLVIANDSWDEPNWCTWENSKVLTVLDAVIAREASK